MPPSIRLRAAFTHTRRKHAASDDVDAATGATAARAFTHGEAASVRFRRRRLALFATLAFL